jgi:hypothetical protein
MPDGVMIVLIGKGAGFIIMIYAAAVLMRYEDPQEMASSHEIPVYVDKSGTQYYSAEEKIFYLNEAGERVFVDANEILGITDIMAVAETDKTGQTNEIQAELPSEEPPELVENESPEPVMKEEIGVQETAPERIEGFSEPYISDTVVRGEPVPFQVFVPRGWKVKQADGHVSVRYKDHTYLNCFGSISGSDNKSYLREELNRVLTWYSGFTVARQEVISIDNRQWAKVQLANGDGDQVLLMTHGGNFGCYSVELNGSFEQLSSHKALLNRMVNSFNLPPSTYFLAQLDTSE